MSRNNVLPITEIINITVSETPQGATLPNVNSLCIFTTEQPINPATFGAFGTYISPSAVASDFGTNSTVAQMANNIFGQDVNILSGDGNLVVIPLLSAVSATKGNFITTNISANIANLAAITNGDLAVTVNGAVYDLANLNFTGCTTLAQVANIIQNALPAGINLTSTSTAITFLSDKVGSSSTVALATYAGGGTDLTGATLLNTSAGAATGGANSTGETILQAIARTSPVVFYCGVMTDLNMEDAVIEATAGGIQALDMLFLPHFTSLTDIGGAITTIKAASQKKTRCLLYTPGQSLANLMKAAYAGRGFSTDFTGSNTCSTQNLKTLNNVLPDGGISQSNYAAAKIAGADLYVSIQGVPCAISTGGNDYFDNQYGILALKFATQTNCFNYLKRTNTKIPQTEAGMNGYKDAIIQVLKQFVTCGLIAPGAWDSPETFGPNPQIFLSNIAQNGYYVYSSPIALQTSAAREARQAPLVQVAAKGAGAIEGSNVLIFFNP